MARLKLSHLVEGMSSTKIFKSNGSWIEVTTVELGCGARNFTEGCKDEQTFSRTRYKLIAHTATCILNMSQSCKIVINVNIFPHTSLLWSKRLTSDNILKSCFLMGFVSQLGVPEADG